METMDVLADPADNRPTISAISLWEFGNLVAQGRLEIGESVEDWLEVAAAPKSLLRF